MGRRPIRVKTYNVRSQFLQAFGLGARVDVVAQQVLDHEAGIFKAVKENDSERALELINADSGECLKLRDSVGATPVHVAFLYGHHELGKTLVLKRKDLAALTYSTLQTAIGELSPYEGENILHIAIVQRNCRLANILEAAEKIKKQPKLRPCGSISVLELKHQQQALSQQLNPGAIAKPTAKNVDKIFPVATSAIVTVSGLFDETPDDKQGEDENLETTIFTTDSFGNNVLHLAVIHDLTKVANFAIRLAILVLGKTGFSLADIDAAPDIDGNGISPLEAPLSREKTDEERQRARIALLVSDSPKLKHESLVDFLRRVDDVRHDKMMNGFFLQRNRDGLTPLSLAAALGNAPMFQHILQQVTSVAWSYGPITALNVPLLELEEPMPMPIANHGRLQWLHSVMSTLPYPLAPQGRLGYKTAIQCMCSLERLSSTISKRDLPGVLEKRVEMLDLIEVRQLLVKKWKYVGKGLFRTRLWFYMLFLVAFNVSTLFQTAAYRDDKTPVFHRIVLGLCEVIAYTFTTVKFMNEGYQLLFNFRSYITEAGAGRLDNVCTLITSLCMFAAGFARVLDLQELNDAFTAVAIVMAWIYQFFFLLGFRTTGPFVIMILSMIQNDIMRFVLVYFSVMAGFSQAVYLVADGRVGLETLVHRGRMLVIAGFTGEVNYEDNYTEGRMNAFTQVLMVCYVILVMILLVNLLIAMMGNTYSEILAKSEQRWVAERANIMSTIENQRSWDRNHAERRRYAIPLATRGTDKEEMFLQLEINNIETWRKQYNSDDDGPEVKNESTRAAP